MRGLRSLGEEGGAHFILAGYWTLYRHVALDYQSPLKNFGEVLMVGALEREACRRLATEPMARMGLDYEDAALSRLLAGTGRRANLIAIACHEILRELGDARKADRRRIVRADVEKAFASKRMHMAPDGWEQGVSDDPLEARPGRMVLYATVAEGDFRLETLVERLAVALGEAGVARRVATRDLETALTLLSIAYVLDEENGVYGYRVYPFSESGC